MTTDEAWEIYDSQKGKNGRPKKEFVEAEAMLIKSGELNPILPQSGDTKKSEDKKPSLLMNIIEEPELVTYQRKVDIYKEALLYITDKRNFSMRYYMTGQYGLTNDILDNWEMEHEYLKRLATIGHDHTQHKLVDGICDKWSGCNPLGAMMMLKAVYGFNDRGDSGALKAEGVIAINAETDDSDFVDIGEYYTEDEGVQSEDQSEYNIQQLDL